MSPRRTAAIYAAIGAVLVAVYWVIRGVWGVGERVSMKLTAIIVCVLASVCAGQSTQPATRPSLPDFEIRGMKIGDRLTEDFARSHTPSKDAGKPDIVGREEIDLAGKKIWVFYQFDDFRLAGVALSFPPEVFADLLSVYKSKLGEPTRAGTEEAKTRLGAVYINQWAEWDTAQGTFTLWKYAQTVEHGSGKLDTPEWRAYEKRKADDGQQKLKEKL